MRILILVARGWIGCTYLSGNPAKTLNVNLNFINISIVEHQFQ